MKLSIGFIFIFSLFVSFSFAQEIITTVVDDPSTTTTYVEGPATTSVTVYDDRYTYHPARRVYYSRHYTPVPRTHYYYKTRVRHVPGYHSQRHYYRPYVTHGRSVSTATVAEERMVL